jgi:hypothetical protein
MCGPEHIARAPAVIQLSKRLEPWNHFWGQANNAREIKGETRSDLKVGLPFVNSH